MNSKRKDSEMASSHEEVLTCKSRYTLHRAAFEEALWKIYEANDDCCILQAEVSITIE